MAFEDFFQKYDRLVLFDTETTGLLFARDEIIQFAAVVLEQRNGKVELALDSGCLMGGNSQCPLWELEVELKEGSQQAAITFAGKLAATYHLIPEEKSKYRRALDLAKGEENHGI